jgi:hypothetical protein
LRILNTAVRTSTAIHLARDTGDFERNRDISTITAIRASVRRGTDAAANVVTFASPHPVVEAKARKVGALQDDGTAADGVDCSGVVRCWLSLWDLCPC